MILWAYCSGQTRVLHKIRIFVYDVSTLDISYFSLRLFVYPANLSRRPLKSCTLFWQFPRQDFIYNHFVCFSFNCNDIFPFNVLLD